MSTQSSFEHDFKRIGWEEEVLLLTDKLIQSGYLVKPKTTETHISLEVNPYPKPNDLDLIKSLIHKQNKEKKK